jgi:DNA-binding MarR family transcriptional regulator
MGSETGDDDIVDVLAQTSFLVMGVLTRIAAEHDLSLTQFRVLAILRDRTLRMSALAEYLGLEKSTLSGLVDRAAARGLVRRGPSATDRRAIEVSITEGGDRLADAGAARVRRELAPVVGRLDGRRQALLQELLSLLLPPAPEGGPESEPTARVQHAAEDERRPQ